LLVNSREGIQIHDVRFKLVALLKRHLHLALNFTFANELDVVFFN
jgi:hypothetical protein